jgi:hypothetical protein
MNGRETGNRTMACTDWEEDLALHHDGELAGDRRRRVEEHLRGCAACRAELEAMDRLDDLVRRAPAAPDAPAEPFRGLEPALARAKAREAWGGRFRAAAAAAAVLLAFAAGALLARRTPDARAERVAALLAEYASTVSEDRREAIAREIEAQGEPARPHLFYALISPSLAQQVAAYSILGRSHDPRVAEQLVDFASARGLMDRAEPEADDILAGPISAEAAVALLDAEGMPREAVLADLRSAYERPRMEPRDVERLRRAGFSRLPETAPGTETILEAIRLKLRDGDLKRRLLAVDAARALRARPLVPELVACLGNEGAREAAWAALREITGQDLPLDASVWERWLRETSRKAGAPAK